MARLRSSSGSFSIVVDVVFHVETVVVPVKEAVVVVKTLIAGVRAIGIAVATVAIIGRCADLTMFAKGMMAVTVAPAILRVRIVILIVVLAVPVSSSPIIGKVLVRHAEC